MEEAKKRDDASEAHASATLGLAFVDVWRRSVDCDLESFAIYLCVLQASSAPSDDTGRAETALSRRAIAERTGFARETVRRKVAELCARGTLAVDDADRVVLPPEALQTVTVQTYLTGMRAAVTEYEKALEILNRAA